MTDYATKSQLSTHQMVPLIVQATNTNQNLVERSKALITKCLNRITTETEISGSHVCHFLLGHTDKKTSHSFTRLNLHSGLAWIKEEMKNYDALDEDILTDVIENNETDETSSSYSINHGNNGLVLVNQMIDYVNRGDGLQTMSLYEYSSKVYKTVLSESECKKMSTNKQATKRRGRKPQPRHLFASSHPQSETHIQVIRTEPLVPSLSLLPPREESNTEKFHICMLLLFKPFSKFTEIYNGISWDDSYSNADFGKCSKFIDNITEMHKGLKEKEDNRTVTDDLTTDTTVEDEDVDFFVETIDRDEQIQDINRKDLDLTTSQAIDIIQSSGWLESTSQLSPKRQFDYDSSLTFSQQNKWKLDFRTQNESKLEKMYSNENNIFQDVQASQDFIEVRNTALTENNVVHISDNIILENENLLQNGNLDLIIQSIIDEFTLNVKQTFAFHLIIENVVKRIKNEETEQKIVYIGGPGGTGKSQIIKAVVALHERMKVRYSLRLCAYTGTAAKHIDGNTLTSLAGLRNMSISVLEKKWNCVSTVIMDEISMVGCRLFAKLSGNITRAKHSDPSMPFGGLDVICFGDFIQFPPVFDTPLYSKYNKDEIGSSTKESEVQMQLGRSIWKQLTHVILLDEQMRVTDQIYQGILNRLREGKIYLLIVALSCIAKRNENISNFIHNMKTRSFSYITIE